MLGRIKTLFSRNAGWQTAEIAGYRVHAKLASEPTSVGINGGRITKLDIHDGEELVVHYSRGCGHFDQQDIPPETLKTIIEYLETV